jgi:hypothetical protein
LDTTRLIFFDMNSRIATAGQQITPTHRCFSRPPQSQTHYLSTGPIGNENGLTIMTDRIAAIAAAATALNKFLKPLAIAAMSIATLMPVTTVPASAKDMLFAVIQEKDGKPSMHYAAGLINRADV